MDYNFTLSYRLADPDSDLEALVEDLGEAGCTDALVGIARPGWLALEFIREADSAQDAVRSALMDVKRAVPAATLIEAAPDFVGLTDVAELVGVSRQNMRKLMLTHPDSFPAPVHGGGTSIWHLVEVLRWLEDVAGYELDQSVVATAQATMEVNLAKEASRLSARSARELKQWVA